jgi:hypothetical protein
MRTDRNRRAEPRDDAASVARSTQRFHERALKRLLLTLLISVLALAAVGYALAFWWN